MPDNKPRLIPLQHIPFDTLDFGITVAEVSELFPFAVKRMYWLRSGETALERGNHAHLNSEQVIVALRGRVLASVTNMAEEQTDFELNSDTEGLYIPSKNWLKIELPKDALLLCFSSHAFEEQQTVYDFNAFLELK